MIKQYFPHGHVSSLSEFGQCQSRVCFTKTRSTENSAPSPTKWRNSDPHPASGHCHVQMWCLEPLQPFCSMRGTRFKMKLSLRSRVEKQKEPELRASLSHWAIHTRENPSPDPSDLCSTFGKYTSSLFKPIWVYVSLYLQPKASQQLQWITNVKRMKVFWTLNT